MEFRDLAVLAWLSPIIYEQIKPFFKPCEIKGKIVSFDRMTNGSIKYQDINLKNVITLQGHQYVLKLSLISLNDNFNLFSAQVRVKYVNGNEDDGRIFWSDNFRVTYDNGERKLLKIPPTKFINFIPVFKKDEGTECYVMFNVQSNDPIKDIEITFTDFKNRSKKLLFNIENLDYSQVEADQTIWEKI